MVQILQKKKIYKDTKIKRNLKELMRQSLGSFGDEGGDKFKTSICGGNSRKAGMDGKW